MRSSHPSTRQHTRPLFTDLGFARHADCRPSRIDHADRCQRSASHSGTTLIELMVVISMLSVVMTLTGITFHLLMRSEKLVSQSFITERTISKLATDFREDVHRAKSGTVATSGEQANRELDLDLANGVHARYQVDKNRITRLLIRDNATAAREDYPLPDCQVRLVPETESDPNRRSLIIDRPGPMITRNAHAPRPMRPLTIEAYLNRWPALPVKSKPESSDDTGTKSDQDGAQP